MGLTECASVAFANPLDPGERRIGSAGRPLAVEARVVAPDGTALADGARGEIEVRGANVMRNRLCGLRPPGGTVLISFLFAIALVALLLHPMSREYQRIWFR